jgi:hypothetical protein
LRPVSRLLWAVYETLLELIKMLKTVKIAKIVKKITPFKTLKCKNVQIIMEKFEDSIFLNFTRKFVGQFRLDSF